MVLKPKIVFSRCFVEPVRYNAELISDELISGLMGYFETIYLCPEVEMGMGVPRQRIILVKGGEGKIYLQPDTDTDLTERVKEYAVEKLRSLTDVDGFILKAKSPSCGVGSCKLYKNGVVIGKTDGLFAEAVKGSFPHLPIEDEGRLRDIEIKRHFLIRVYAFADFRTLLNHPTPKGLVDFHTRHKYLLMTYNQARLKRLGQIVADSTTPFGQRLIEYKTNFYEALSKRPASKRHINTLQHIIGYFSDRLNQKEKGHLFALLDKFRTGHVKLMVLIELIRNLAYRFELDYLTKQSYLSPFPDELWQE